MERKRQTSSRHGFKCTEIDHGTFEYEFTSWQAFNEYQIQLLDYQQYIFRGQRDSGWSLASSYDRLVKNTRFEKVSFSRRGRHLASFKKAVRGRTEPGRAFPEGVDLWTLGQHYGLATPLLDWTESAFVAAFFAFEEQEPSETGFRAVWALHTRKLHRGNTNTDSPIELIDPDTGFNPRLLSQRGLFTRVTKGGSLEGRISTLYEDDEDSEALIKFLIPESERIVALKLLNRMNINHLSLFPDLHGASQYCNLRFQIPNY